MAFGACAYCDRPVSPKARQVETLLGDGRVLPVHGTCVDGLVSTALDVRERNLERDHLENGPRPGLGAPAPKTVDPVKLSVRIITFDIQEDHEGPPTVGASGDACVLTVNHEQARRIATALVSGLMQVRESDAADPGEGLF